MLQSRQSQPCDSWKPYVFLADKIGEFYWRWLKIGLGFLLLGSFLLVFYPTFSPQFHWKFPKCPVVEENYENRIVSLPDNPTNISHIVFGLGGSAKTWQNRRHYSELWWKPGKMRGFVWLEEKPSGRWPEKSPPYRVSEDTSRFKDRNGLRSAVRMARIVLESVRLGFENVRWFVMGDDDTVFFTENLVTVLGKYDHEEFYYIGGVSESVEQDVMHSYGLAFGGGGFAISYGLARELARVLDGCLDRYANFYGSDERIHACITEIGAPLAREAGFHQVDLRGSVYGLLAAHPMSPLVSLHHMEDVDPIIPAHSQHDALRSLVGASQSDPGRIIQQSICHDKQQKWSVSLSWGYTVQVYPRILTAMELSTPLRTFRTWRSYHDGPFTFNTRPWSSDVCEQPLVYFLERLEDMGEGGTWTVYSRHRNEPGKECDRAEYVAPLMVDTVTVFASKMISQDWRKAPRRQCCDVRSDKGVKNGIQVNVRKCHPGESLSPP